MNFGVTHSNFYNIFLNKLIVEQLIRAKETGESIMVEGIYAYVAMHIIMMTNLSLRALGDLNQYLIC